MHATRLVNFMFGFVGVCPLLVMAAEPATQPVSSVSPAPFTALPAPDSSPASADATGNTAGLPNASNPGFRRFDGSMMPRGRFGLQTPVKDSDIADARKFMEEHSKKRLAFIDSLPDGDRKTRVMETATRAFLRMNANKNQDPELYKVEVQRAEVEDDIFGLVTELRKAPPEAQEGAQADLRTAVGKLVDIGLLETQLRLDRLAKTVQDQQKKLADDRENRESLIDERLKSILNEGKRMFPALGNGGGNHMHGSGPRGQDGEHQTGP